MSEDAVRVPGLGALDDEVVPGPSGLATFTLDVDALGKGRLLVNGDEVDFARLALVTGGGDVTRLIVHQVVGAAKLTGSGVVEVPAETTGDGSEVGVFLRGIDSGELERAALGRLGMGGDEDDLMKATLATLIEWADGR